MIITDKSDKASSILRKLTWLGDIVNKLVRMDKHYLGTKWIDASANKHMSMIELLRGKLQQGRMITKSDMKYCNDIFKRLKREYEFNTDWRGDITDCKKYNEFIMNQEK